MTLLLIELYCKPTDQFIIILLIAIRTILAGNPIIMNIVLESKQAKNWSLFLALALMYTLITIYIDKFLISADVYQQSLSHNLTQEQIEEILGLKDKYSWSTYLFGIIFIFIKCSLIAFVIYAGGALSGQNIGLSKSLKIVLLAEFLFLVPLIVKIAWFTFVEDDFTLERIQSFYPLSLLSLFSSSNVINKIWIYPFQTLNVFELVYWFALAWYIRHFTGKDFDTSLRIVIMSYLPCLLLWIIFVMFVTVTITGF